MKGASLSMQMSAECMACLLNRQAGNIQNYPDEAKKAEYLQMVMRAISEAEKSVSAPLMTARINDIHRAVFGFGEDLSAEKHLHNQMMLRVADDAWKTIRSAEDPLSMALRYARAGNYIDLGAMDSVDDETLLSLLNGAREETIDDVQYRLFREALSCAEQFLLVHDNAGEIVMDMLLIRIVREMYPHLSVTSLVRGALTSNDATMEDAEEIGLSRYARVIGNGTDIAGTELSHISREAKEALSEADVILAKGQGNFETMFGCGLPVFYMFLCKCDWFMKLFQKPRFSGVFVRERDVTICNTLVEGD
jgi:uncharacterized protein with ATP-grasp and redox domains